jgi:DNA-binding winged helix-turn-helix (wHTH) protein/tetratricopeptide (TPR) repeat protein
VRYRFGEFELDLKLYELRCDGATRPVEPQVFDVLACLVRNRDRVVTKEELLDEVWGDRFVSESTLTSRIKGARQAVGDDGRRQLVIRTVHGRGYRFVADVVEDDPGLAAARVGLRGGSSGLVERDTELVELVTALGRAVSERRGSVVLVSGEAGVGKSALVRAFLDVAEADAVVLLGGCDDMITPRVLGPVRDMAALAGDDLADTLAAGAEQGDLIGAFLGVLARQPTVVVVEDLHWADDATIDVVRALSRQARRLPAVVVLTYREEDLGPDHAFRGVLGVLIGPEVHRIRLAPLTREGVAALAGDAVDPDQLHSVTKGNPFFVTEVLASPDTRVPPTVRDAVLARLARLKPETRLLLRHLAVVPSRAERWLAEALLAEAGTALAEAERRGVLGGDASHVWFPHEVARRVVEEEATAMDRVRSNRLVVELLEEHDGAERDRLVHHAARAHDVDRVLRHGPPAALDAARLGSHRQAVELIGLVLPVADGLPIGEVARLSVQLAYSLYVVNQFDQSQQAATRAVELAGQGGDPLVLGDALVMLARISFWAQGPVAARAAAEHAVALLEGAGDDLRLASAVVELARVRSNLATIGSVAEPSPDALDTAERAVALAGPLGRGDLLGQALMYRGSDRLDLGDPRGYHDIDEAIALAAGDPRVELRVRACVNASGSAFRSGRLEEAERFVDLGLDLAAGAEFFAGEYRLGLTRLTIGAARGEWPRVEHGLDQLIRRPGQPGIMRALARSLLARLLARRSAWKEAEDVLGPALDEAAGSDEVHLVGPVVAARLELAWLRGDDADMERIARPGLEAAARCGHRTSRAELGRWLQRAGLPFEPGDDEPGPWGPALVGDWRAAADGWARLGERYERALELAASGDERASDEGMAELADLGATASVARLRARS